MQLISTTTHCSCLSLSLFLFLCFSLKTFVCGGVVVVVFLVAEKSIWWMRLGKFQHKNCISNFTRVCIYSVCINITFVSFVNINICKKKLCGMRNYIMLQCVVCVYIVKDVYSIFFICLWSTKFFKFSTQSKSL